MKLLKLFPKFLFICHQYNYDFVKQEKLSLDDTVHVLIHVHFKNILLICFTLLLIKKEFDMNHDFNYKNPPIDKLSSLHRYSSDSIEVSIISCGVKKDALTYYICDPLPYNLNPIYLTPTSI